MTHVPLVEPKSRTQAAPSDSSIEQNGKWPLIMAMTGYGQEEAKQAAREAGFDYHMTKPILPDKLQTLLSSAPSLVGGRL